MAAAASLVAGCATEVNAAGDIAQGDDALTLFGLDLTKLKEEKAKRRSELIAKQAEELANPTRRTKITKLWNSDGPKADDVVQNMSNCYFAAAAAAFAHARPEFVQFAIQPRYEIVNNRNTSNQLGYQVNTFGMAEDGSYNTQVAQTIDIENTLPLDERGRLLFGRGGNGTFWFPVLERAFARDHGGYDKIGAYGMADAALFRITGVHVTTGLVAKWRKEAAWRRVVAAEDHKQPFVACTVLKTPLKGMSEHHCNALVGYEKKDGQRYIRMYNSRRSLFLPENNQRVSENTPNGYYWLTLDEFIGVFDVMSYTTEM